MNHPAAPWKSAEFTDGENTSKIYHRIESGKSAHSAELQNNAIILFSWLIITYELKGTTLFLLHMCNKNNPIDTYQVKVLLSMDDKKKSSAIVTSQSHAVCCLIVSE